MAYLEKPAPSPGRRDALHEYVKEVRRLLFLQHWRIDLPNEWPDVEDVSAQIVPVEGRYLATLRFGEGFWSQSPDEARATITHELLHLHHVRLSDVVREGEYRHELGRSLYEHLYDQVRHESELMTDALTSLVVELLPLPPAWPD